MVKNMVQCQGLALLIIFGMMPTLSIPSRKNTVARNTKEGSMPMILEILSESFD